MNDFSYLLQRSNGNQHEQSFRAVVVLSPTLILSENAIFEETFNSVLSWSMIESHVHHNTILQDMKVVDQSIHCMDVLHYRIEEYYDYPFTQFTMGNIVLVRIINSSPRTTHKVGMCLDIDQYVSHLRFLTHKKTCTLL
jgi:hypothetical protein